MISSFLKVTEPSENSQPESAEGMRKERVRLRKGGGQQGKESEREGEITGLAEWRGEEGRKFCMRRRRKVMEE